MANKGIGLSDQEIADRLVEQAETAAAESAPEQPNPTPTLADRFVGIANLIVEYRGKARLSESTLVKAFEIALQFHAWQTQMDAQAAQQQSRFDPRELMGMGGDGEPAGEYIGEAPDDYELPADIEPSATTEEV